jgi:predicted polyphosphate/ATP-dependent NAD kinase
MALINIQSAIKRVRQIVDKLEPPQGVEILTYKRNRGITIIKIDDETLSVQERGYEENSFQVTINDLTKLLKSIAKREFPRSRKVRVYQLDSPYCLGVKRKQI